VERTLVGEGIEGKSYTVTNATLPTWRDFFQALQKGLGRKQRVYVPIWLAYVASGVSGLLQAVLPRFERELSYYRIKRITTETTYDISRTVSDLGYQPDNDFERQFAEVVEWYLKERRNGYLA
jgi:nucleoside-diphosphate-sugar epimerase